jgi:hypothetical protein
MPIGGGEESLVHPSAGFGDWALVEQDICSLNRGAGPQPAFELLHLDTGETTRLAALTHWPLAFWPSVSPDGRWILYSVDNGTDSDIMLVEGFR